ncbi:rhomboid family intramembrane serine protease [Aquibacillus kalidii]|uniref:rhomboid family intramembrane serine protease n=1 Tax=Aquibacillus kalidii TaxID=2762597 RepID=UPI001648FAC3|nr:rhomboid family intramembrane serine protease [Aquibacillus kalidii]
MFIRTESFKDFIRFYPLITAIVIFQLALWLCSMLIPPLGDVIYQYGVGQNYLISQGQYWRLVTAVFLHDPNGITHVLFNCFSLVLFGPPLEQMLGKFKFFLTYLLTGVIANVLTLFSEPSNYFYLGASGAVYGLFGLYIFIIVLRKHLIDRGSAQVIVTILVIGLIMSFMRSGVGVSAHIFGFISGFALGPVLLQNAKPFSPYRNQRKQKDQSIPFDPNRWNKRRFPFKKYIGPVLWGILGLLVLLGIMARFL